MAVLAGPRNGVETPSQLAREGVERPDISARALRLTVTDPATDNDLIAARRDRRGIAIAQVWVLVDSHAGLKIGHAVNAEGGVERVGFGVNAEQASELISEKDAFARTVGPVGKAAAVVEIDALRAVELGIELPDRFTRHRVEREQTVEDGDYVENTLDEQRGGLEGGAGRKRRAVGELARVVDPCDFEAADIRRVDLVKSGVAHASRVIAVGGPILGERCEGERKEQRDGERAGGKHLVSIDASCTAVKATAQPVRPGTRLVGGFETDELEVQRIKAPFQ